MMIYKNIKDFLRKRAIELGGLTLISTALLLSICFFSYSPSDPTLIYGAKNIVINNLLGIYGGLIADFLLQSFGLAAFLILIIFSIWGISLIFKKKIKNIQFKIFYLILNLIFTCIFIYATFNNSFWLIDNGNSGFVGQILYKWISIFLPGINNQYAIFVLITLSLFFFILASNINLNYFLNIFYMFKKNKILVTESEYLEEQPEDLVKNNHSLLTPQQTFPFEGTKDSVDVNTKHVEFKNFKLPSVDLLERNPSKSNLLDQSKNRPDGKFIEKILLDLSLLLG
jgi:hypothetical protein